MERKLSIQAYCRISIAIAIICAVSQIIIPMPYGVPLTLQTFIIPVIAIVLGYQGTIAVAVYILMGALGLPVFSGFTGGLHSILGPTGGFIISFPLLSLCTSWGAKKKQPIWILLGLLLGTVLNFMSGMIVYSIIMQQSITTAFIVCVLPFLPTTIIKIVATIIIGIRLQKVIRI